MVTAGLIHYVLNLLHLTVHIRDVCVFLAPVFSGLTSISTFLLTRELWNQGAGLLAACFIAIVPGYISRSVAGSFDNEGIAIFALQFTYYLWVSSILKYNSSLVQFFLTVVLKITAQWMRRLSVNNLPVHNSYRLTSKDFEYSAWVMRTGFMILLRTVLKWLKTHFSKCCAVLHGWNKKLTLIDIHHIFSAEWQDSWNGCSGSILCLFWRCDF